MFLFIFTEVLSDYAYANGIAFATANTKEEAIEKLVNKSEFGKSFKNDLTYSDVWKYDITDKDACGWLHGGS